MNVVSFSLWGSSKLYCVGALQNIHLVHKYYPGWIPRFYVAENCPVLHDLKVEASLNNCEVVIKPPTGFVWGSTVNVKEHQDPSHINMVWRYEAVFDSDVDTVIFRDTDSRVSARDADSVFEWMNRVDIGHAIYEREVHHSNGGVMPGMSGLKSFFFKNQKDNYYKSLEEFKLFYSIEGYRRGVRLVHFDIHWFNNAFFRQLEAINHIYKCGYGTPNPLKVPVDPLAGEVGSTVNEQWRYESYVD